MIHTSLPQIISYGHSLDMTTDKIGTLKDSSDAINDVKELRTRFEDEGYLYIKGYLDKDKVLEARAALTEKLAAINLLDENYPVFNGITKPNTGHAFKPEITNNCPQVQGLLYSGKIVDFYTKFYEETVRHYDYTWLRAVGPGKGTNPHCDLPYMGRGTHKHMTCWVPYGDIPYELGGLMVLEKSHNRMDLLENYVYRDVDSFCKNKETDISKVKEGKWVFTGTLSHNPTVIRNKFGNRWLVSEFEPGDFVTFGMFTVHASLDNQTINRLRISSDSRYQRASEPVDERWIGINPAGHGVSGKRGLIC
jgi:hypothetical protein